MRGKVAKGIRNLIHYKEEMKALEYTGPEAVIVKKEMQPRMVLNPEGEFSSKDGKIKYDIKEDEIAVWQLRCPPIRQIYKHMKKEWKSLTRDDHRRLTREGKGDTNE